MWMCAAAARSSLCHLTLQHLGMFPGAPCALRHSVQQLSGGLKRAIPASDRILRVHDFGSELIDYEKGLQLQEKLAEKRHSGETTDTLLQLQVVTMLGDLLHFSAPHPLTPSLNECHLMACSTHRFIQSASAAERDTCWLTRRS